MILNSITKSNLTTTHLTMDSYLMNRSIRKKEGLSGYNVEAYSHKKTKEGLMDLSNGETIDFRHYDHNSGENSVITFKMNPTDIIYI